jgi:hypothetical protein
MCVGWWSGWTSATIARLSYPPPEKLKPRTADRLAIVSLVLVAVGVMSVIRVLITGRRRRCTQEVAAARPPSEDQTAFAARAV